MIIALGVMMMLPSCSMFGGNEEPVNTTDTAQPPVSVIASLPGIEPDAFAPSIFFRINTINEEMKVSSATVVMLNEKDVPKWKRSNFYVDASRSTVRFENEAYVFSLKRSDGKATLHGSIAEEALALMQSDSAGTVLYFQAHDVRLWNQVQHQRVTATFDPCTVHVGDVANTHVRKY